MTTSFTSIRARRFALRVAVLCSVAMLATGCASEPSTADGTGSVGNYQFGYRISSPSGIRAQVFSGESHTYVSLPTHIMLQAAMGNGRSYIPKRHGAYWVIPALATHWNLATSQGLVNATATGAALQMARVDSAQSVISQTVSAVKTQALPLPGAALPGASLPGATPHVGNKAKAGKTHDVISGSIPTPSVHPHPQVKTDVASQAHAPTGNAVPAEWLSAAIATSSHHHHVRMIPGSDGRFLPLSQAMPKITPMGWTTHFASPVSPSMTVNWHAGPWTESLHRMALSNGLVDHVNWGVRQVTLRATPALLKGIPGMGAAPIVLGSSVTTHRATGQKRIVAATPKALNTTTPIHVLPMLPATLKPATGTGQTTLPFTPGVPAITTPVHTKAIPAPVPVPSAMPVIFTAHKGDMLSHDLRIYLHAMHWHLAWNVSKNWPIRYGFVLSGSLHSVTNQLKHLYHIQITGYRVNKTVSVTPANQE